MDIFNLFVFGNEIEAHGEKWLSLQSLGNGFYLAVKPDEKLPCDIKLVKVEDQS